MNNNLTLPLMQALNALSDKFRKPYVFVTQKRMVELLAEYYDHKLSIRTLNRWLRHLEDQCLIRRQRRLRRNPDGTLYAQSTLTHVFKQLKKKLSWLLTTLYRAGVKLTRKLREDKTDSDNDVQISKDAFAAIYKSLDP